MLSCRSSIETMAAPNRNGRKSATRSKLRVNEAAGVTGKPLSMTTLMPTMLLPGVAPERPSSKATG